MKNLHRIPLCLGLAALTGCASVNIESSVRPSYDRKVSDLCVLASCARSIDAPFFEGLKGSLEAALEARNIRAAVLVVKPAQPGAGGGTLSVPYATLPLGDGKPTVAPALPTPGDAAIQAGFKPAFFMTLQMVETGRSAGKASARFRLGLKASGDGQDVWKAMVSLEWSAASFGPPGAIYSGESAIGMDSREVVAKIIERLAQDRLI